MIASMTGFGRGTATVRAVTATVELRAVNNRHCDVSVRLPGSLAAHEGDIQAHIKQAFARGRFNVNVQVEGEEDTALPIEVDSDAAANYRRLLDQLRDAARVQTPVQLEHLLHFSDVFTTVDEEEDIDEEAWDAVQVALGEAIEQLRTMRRQEGEALRTDLEARIDAIAEHLATVQARAPKRVEAARDRLDERLARLMRDGRIDPDRLEAEVAILADKLDVTEECVRLQSHLDLFREALDNQDAVGRKLKFITQEIHREVNTIGAKANDAPITEHAVQMKEAVEQIREQVRNVE
jgi:uncharacterized protein (TIGR00255 family)